MNKNFFSLLIHIFLITSALLYAAPSTAGGFKAGFAQVNITPEIGEEMMMVGGGTGPVKSIGDSLYAKAVILSDGVHEVVLISVDLIDLRESDFRMLKKHLELNKGFDHVVITVTHTHGGFFGDILLDEVLPKILKSVELAKESMQPVKIGAINVSVDEAYNRRIQKVNEVEMLWSNPARKPNRTVDQLLGIIQMLDEKENPFITLLNYSAHPVITMNLNEVIVSADYPGQLYKEIEEKLGGHVVFFMGASGDVNPYNANTLPFEDAQNKSKEMGMSLALKAIKAVEKIDIYYPFGEFKFETVQFENPHAQVGLLLLTPGISLSNFPGEYFDQLGRKFKEESPTEFTFFIGKSNGDLRYVPTKEDANIGGFGADKSSIRVKDDTGETHIEIALKCLKNLSEN